MNEEKQKEALEFPLDTLTKKYFNLDFFRFGVLLLLVLVIIQIGLCYRDIPAVVFSYPFWFDCMLILLFFFGLKKLFTEVDKVRLEIISNQADKLENKELEQIDADITESIKSSFAFGKMFVAGIIVGVWVVSMIFVTGVAANYPYHLFNFVFGFLHGFAFIPIISQYQVVKKAKTHIHSIEILDPDGLGGYREIGRSVLNLTALAIVAVTVDFIILSSVAFVASALFHIMAIISLSAVIIIILIDLCLTTFSLRQKLLDLRDKRIQKIGDTFSTIERDFWEKITQKEEVSREAFALMSLNNLFEQTRKMDMWPIDLLSFSKLMASIFFSVIIIFLQVNLDEVIDIVNSVVLP